MRKRSGVTALLAAALLLTGCAVHENEGKIAEASPGHGHEGDAGQSIRGSLDVSVLRGSEADYDFAPSPEALAGRRPIVAAGVVEGWQQGPVLETYKGGPLDYRVVLKVRVTDALKGVKGRTSMPANLAFVELDQGAVIRDDSLTPEKWKPERSVRDFAASIPPGTKVMIFPTERPAHEQKVLDEGERLPARARLMSVPPQGLVFEDPLLAQQKSGRSALVGGKEPLQVAGRSPWLEPKNMSELVDRLRSKGFSE
ncbi:hypothetical protein ACLQ2R_16250 [Streptosporangium sp. DT93]|uniref:hypothetical protein n=1 Tax=Streptosporangium sp. DT93 TaxID=3393428 RepID=UPI003CFB8BCF